MYTTLVTLKKIKKGVNNTHNFSSASVQLLLTKKIKIEAKLEEERSESKKCGPFIFFIFF